MITSLIESIQKNLGFPELTKIDPNTQQATAGEAVQPVKHFGQAAIPAVLTGLYKLGSTEHGADQILRGNTSAGWLDVLFGDNKQNAVQQVASYSGEEGSSAAQHMEGIAQEAVKLIRQNLPANATFADVKTFIADQRSEILKYLPGELQMGKVMNDNTLDDRSNKMEGPMSNSMHFFEKLFSGGTVEKNERSGYDDLK